MDFVNVQALVADGDSYIEYSMFGFNIQSSIGENVTDKFEITENKPYIYKKHDFLFSFVIEDILQRLFLK